MEWIKALRGKVVGLDTTPVIYFIEERAPFLDVVEPFFEAMDRGEFSVVTSTVTLLEVLVHPLRRRDTRLARQYREILLGAKGLTIIPLSPEIAQEAARQRAERNLRTPDAIQIATAIKAGAAAFVTNDSRLSPTPGLPVLLLDELIGRRKPTK